MKHWRIIGKNLLQNSGNVNSTNLEIWKKKQQIVQTHPILECVTIPLVFLFRFSVLGSLPPSPADSGVSDVDSSSSGHASTDELKARLQPSIHSPVGNLFSRHPALNWNGPIHQHTQRQGHLSQQFYQPFATSEFLSINAEQILVECLY